MMMTTTLSMIPFLGSGIGYRPVIHDEILRARGAIDFIEIIADQYLFNPAALAELEQLSAIFRVVPHGVGLSIGSVASPDRSYLRAIRRVSDLTRSPYYSEHLAMTQAPGIDIGHLSPLWFTEPVLRAAVDNVRRVQDALGKPLALENVTYLFDIPRGEMRQTDFFCRLVDATGCGVLLDITNLSINAVNHRFDPVTFLGQMPLHRVLQVHLAGGCRAGDLLIDSHSEPVAEDSWALLEEVVTRTHLRGSILEHDANFPPRFSALLDQIMRARVILQTSARVRPESVMHRRVPPHLSGGSHRRRVRDQCIKDN